ncbi:MAG: D-alanyl-D-alanine carboxypeptidase [Actinobacteria bacterium]|nr:D-alanyl-D-alanine carboxypeptidase [Actinomycetota bacterium]
MGAPRPGALILIVVIIVVILAGIQLLRPTPSATLQSALPASYKIPGTPPSMPWPTQGEATVEVNGVGSFGSSGGETPEPIASVAKMMTALVVLTDHPLTLGQQGPTIHITPADVALEQTEAAQQDSVVAVAPGETLTEYQALQALLIPSGNNIAMVLADWDAGSEAAFVAKMNAKAKALGMVHTHYADVSGISGSTVSTATDQLILTKVVMANPVFAHIVGEAQVTLPVAGVQENYDYNLGKDGFVGTKTGSDSTALGCFAFTSDHQIDGHRYQIMGVVLGQPATISDPSELQVALDDATALVNAVVAHMTLLDPVPTGTTVAHIDAAWSSPIPVTTKSTTAILGWPGMPLATRLDAKLPSQAVPAGTVVGTLEVRAGKQAASIPVTTSAPFSTPSLGWKLTRL